MTIIPSILLSAVLSCSSLPADVQGIIDSLQNNGCAEISCADDASKLIDTLNDMGIKFSTNENCSSLADILNTYLNCGKDTQAPTETPEVTEAPASTQMPQATTVPAPTELPQATAEPTKAPQPTNTPAPTKAPQTTNTPNPTKTPQATAAPTAAPDISNPQSSYAYEVVTLVNQERAKYGLSALSVDETLMKAAQKRAIETVTSFSHTRPNGSKFSTVLSEYGVSYRTSGENIAYGQKTPQDVVTAWMNSSGHRANILNSSYTKIGVGCYKSGSTYYWSQLFIG